MSYTPESSDNSSVSALDYELEGDEADGDSDNDNHDDGSDDDNGDAQSNVSYGEDLRVRTEFILS